jgi:hypothetical protein
VRGRYQAGPPPQRRSIDLSSRRSADRADCCFCGGLALPAARWSAVVGPPRHRACAPARKQRRSGVRTPPSHRGHAARGGGWTLSARPLRPSSSTTPRTAAAAAIWRCPSRMRTAAPRRGHAYEMPLRMSRRRQPRRRRQRQAASQKQRIRSGLSPSPRDGFRGSRRLAERMVRQKIAGQQRLHTPGAARWIGLDRQVMRLPMMRAASQQAGA